MSGVKQATVTDSLDKTLDIIEDGIAKYVGMAERTAGTGRRELDAKRTDAKRLKPTRELRSDLKPFLAGETAKWESLLERFDKSLKNAESLYDDASDKIRDYDSHKRRADATIESIREEADRIRAAVMVKDWYCDEENEEAKRLGREASSVLRDLRDNASLCSKAQNLSQKSFAAFSETEKLARLAQEEYDRLVSLGEERLKQQKIREENQRNAMRLVHDLRSLRSTIESKNYAKFGAGAYSAVQQNQIANIEALVAAGKFEQALNAVPGLKKRLEDAARTIEDNQLAWETAKTAAEKALADAREEIAGFDREEMNQYSGESGEEIQANFDAVETAAGLIRAENFAAAAAMIESALQKIRATVEKTLENKAAADHRIEVAQCIMAALNASKYDEPVAYLEDENDNLSDLCIVAAAPGGVADMTMRIGLNGTVDFVVENIPEGQEQLCEAAVKQLQENMGEEFRFTVTDWGRAGKDHPQHLNLPPVPEKTKEQTKDKRRT